MVKDRLNSYFTLTFAAIPILLITGPFLPDFTVTAISISFLIYIFFKKRFELFKDKFFLFFLFFYLIIIISSLNSDHLFSSLKTSISYLRFGLLFLCIGFMCKNFKDFPKYILNSLILIFTILFIDSLFQKIFSINLVGMEAPFGRITSFFGNDVKLGGYIIRLAPLFLSLLIFFRFKEIYILSALITSLILTLISGERTSFLMCSLLVSGYIFFNEYNIKKKILILFTPIILFFFTISVNETLKFRIYTSTLNQINFLNKEPFYKEKKVEGHNVIVHRDSTLLPRVYHMYFETSKKIFFDYMLLGSGPRTYQYKSREKKYLTVSNHAAIDKIMKEQKRKIELPGFTNISGANNHPHNTYLQIISETGLVGFILLSFVFLFSLAKLFSDIDLYKKIIILGIVINIFPFMFAGNFFNNWLSILYFYPLGFLNLSNFNRD